MSLCASLSGTNPAVPIRPSSRLNAPRPAKFAPVRPPASSATCSASPGRRLCPVCASSPRVPTPWCSSGPESTALHVSSRRTPTWPRCARQGGESCTGRHEVANNA
jgi:hypothetical protein